MQDYHQIIINEICYNEIIDDSNLFADIINGKNFENSIIQLSDGSLLCCISIDASDINLYYYTSHNRKKIISSFLSSLPNNIEINYEWKKIKEDFNYISFEKTTSGSIREIEVRRKKLFEKNTSFVNKIYISIIKRNIIPTEVITKQNFAEFIQICSNLISALNNTDSKCTILEGEELLEYLKFSLDYSDCKIKPINKVTKISNAILTDEYKLKNIPLVIFGDTKKYVSCFTVTALPQYTQPDLFSFCSFIDFEFRLLIKYKNYDKIKSEKIIKHKKKSYKNSMFSLLQYVKKDITKEDFSDEFSHSAFSGKQQCDEALSYITNSNSTTGDCQISMIIFDTDENKLEKNCLEIKKIFSKNGFLLKREIIGNTLCFLSNIIGCKRFYNPIFVLSENFADMFHLYKLSEGSKNSTLLRKKTNSNAPLIYARNLDNSIYYFNLYGDNGNKGHTFISGPTGSGKSVLMSLISAQWLKYDNTRVIIIDRDLSSYRLINDNNGKFFYPLGDNTQFQPLYNAKNNLNNVIEFIKSLCFAQNTDFNSNIIKEIYFAVELLEERKETLTQFYHIVKGRNKSSPLLNALYAYLNSEKNISIFDGNENTIQNLGRLSMIETGKIISNSVNNKTSAIPFFIYLLSILDNIFNDYIPTILSIDESWKIISNPIFSKYFEEWMKTLRKKNVDIIFSITNIKDITSSDIAETILGNTQTKILFKDAHSSDLILRAGYEKISLSPEQIDLLQVLPDFCPMVIQDNNINIVDFKINNQIEYLSTPNLIKKKILNEENI